MCYVLYWKNAKTGKKIYGWNHSWEDGINMAFICCIQLMMLPGNLTLICLLQVSAHEPNCYSSHKYQTCWSLMFWNREDFDAVIGINIVSVKLLHYGKIWPDNMFKPDSIRIAPAIVGRDEDQNLATCPRVQGQPWSEESLRIFGKTFQRNWKCLLNCLLSVF